MVEKLTDNEIRVLFHLKDSNEGLRYSDLQNRIRISHAGLTKLLDKLTSKGLIKREVRNEKPVAVFYQITENGLKTLEKISKKELIESLKLYSPVLDEEDRKEVEALIQKLKKKYDL